MTTLNTSYAEQESAFAGMLANAMQKKAVTLVQGEASAEIPFGVMVCQGDASAVAGTPDDAILMVDTNSKMLGIVLHHHNYTRGTDLGDTGVKPERLITVLEEGEVYVFAEAGAYVKGAQLYARFDAGAGGSQMGAIRVDADTATAKINKGLTAAETKTLAAAGYVKCRYSQAAYLASL